MKMIYSDQTKFFDPSKWTYPIHLIGAGGINNLVGPTLAKMGITEIHIWDNDILEPRNCPTEVAYSYDLVGQPKAIAMQKTIERLMPSGSVKIFPHYERVTSDTDQLEGVVVSGVDSMESRQTIWEVVQRDLISIPLYIDGRSGGRFTQVFALSPADFEAVEKYESWLFSDDKAMKLPCGARNFPPVAAYFAMKIPAIIASFQRDETVEFYTKYEV